MKLSNNCTDSDIKFLRKILSIKPIFILIGIFNICFFHYAIYRLFVFLYDSTGRQPVSHMGKSIFINSLLILFFTIPHSYLLISKVRVKLIEYIPKELYLTAYSLHACLSIVLLDLYWVEFGSSFYHLEGYMRLLFNGIYVLSWLFMFWAMLSTGLFRQSGIEQWYKSLKKQKMNNTLPSDGAYSFCRHPIYAAFLAIIWSTPNMSYDHLFLSVCWSVYIVWGAGQKEKRLQQNSNYKKYALNVPSFPFLGKKIETFLIRKIWRITL